MQEKIQAYLQRNGFERFAPKVVLFDMDGVLYDSMPNHAVAWQRSMQSFGLKMTAHDAYATEGARGVDTIRALVKAQTGRDIDEAEAQRMYDVKAAEFAALPKAPVMPGVRDVMRLLRKNGLRVGVVTGSGQRPLIRRIADDFQEWTDMDDIVTAYDVKQGKPAPDPYLKGLEKAGRLMPWEGIVVENAPLGVRAGVAARILTLAVNSGPLPDEALAGAGADCVFSDMFALRDALNAWFNE